MSALLDRMRRIAESDARTMRAILLRNLPAACAMCGTGGGEIGQMTAIWNGEGMHCVAICRRCTVQMNASTEVTVAMAGGSEARLGRVVDRIAQGLGIDPALSREGEGDGGP